jgi:hypothetical protein
MKVTSVQNRTGINLKTKGDVHVWNEGNLEDIG